MTRGPGGALRLAWRIWRGEGARGLADRLRDRLADARRRRSFRPAGAAPAGFSCAVLHLAAAPPEPRLGGTQAQLLWRLGTQADRGLPVALLYPKRAAAGGGWRLELQRGEERRALRLTLPEATGAAPSAAGPGPTTALGNPAPASVLDAPAPAMALGDPAPATTLDDPALERAVAWAASRCGATVLQVEGLAGMPFASLLRLRQAGLRLVLVVHDFAAFCPRPHLLESPEPPAPPRFCHYSRDAERCARCLGRDFAGLPPGYQERRRELARQLLASADAVVYPSPFLARTCDELFAGAGHAVARVIAPAVPAGSATPPSRGGRPRPLHHLRHAAWVGAVQPHKGALIFEEAARRLLAAGAAGRGRLRLTAYGGGDAGILARWRRIPGLAVRGYYRAGSLPALLRRDRADLALLLSVVPESYGMTLDECAAAGVPVVAFDLGAPAERITAGGSGLLLAAPLADDPAAGGAALAGLLADLMDGREKLPPPPPLSTAVAATPSEPSRPGPWPAAGGWSQLYRELGLTSTADPLA